MLLNWFCIAVVVVAAWQLVQRSLLLFSFTLFLFFPIDIDIC